MSELTEIQGIAGATANALNDVGIETKADLAKADPSVINEAASHLNAQDVKEAATQSTIMIQSGDEVAEEMGDKSFITTGIDGLDEIMDGGWEEGMTAGIYGKSGEGKSQIAMHSLIAGVEDTGLATLYLETEQGNYRPNRMQSFASDPSAQDKVYKIGGIDDLEDQMNAYEAIDNNFDKDDLGMIAIDSFNAHFRDEYVGRQELSDRAAEMKAHLNRLNRLSRELQVPILLLLQSYGSPEAYGKQDTPYGGNVMIHNIGYFFRMSNGTGDLKQATVENHPGLDEQAVLLSIGEDSIDFVKSTDP